MKRLASFLALSISLLGARAAFAFDIEGTLPDMETIWAGSVNIIGDVTVAAGRKLTIQPGTIITVAGNDHVGSGANASKSELIVSGTLEIPATSGQPVTFSSSDSWYGVRVLAGGTATINYTTFSSMLHGVDLAATSSISNSTFNGLATASDGCLYLSGASNASTITQNTFSKCSYVAIVTSAGSPSFAKNVIDQPVYNAFSIQGGSPSIDHNTMNGGGSYPIYTTLTASTVTLTNNIISNWSGTYAFYNSNASTINADYNDIWKPALGSYVTGYSINDGAHNLHANPLYVSGSNLRITSNSPARKADSTGGDAGALAYTGDATPSLMGTLYVDTTLSGSKTLDGDLTVAPGVTLTLAAGATLTAPTDDKMSAGANLAKTEIIVRGTLVVQGQNAGNVTLTSSDSWYGVRVLAGGTATINYTTFSNMLHGVDLAATSSISNSTFNGLATASDGCLYLSGASNASTITQNTFSKCSYVAIVTSAGSPSFAKNVIDQTIYNAFSIQGGSPNIDHNTMNGGGSYPIYTSLTASTVTLTNNVISNWSATYAFYNSNASTINADYNDIWKPALGSYVTGYSINDGAHNLHANPLYVSASNFRITSNSPARKADSSGGDIGALAYVSDATVPLMGTLYVDTTLSGSKALDGDLTVAPGVTLTLAAGTTLTAPTDDKMSAGANLGKTEIIVRGTLIVQGQSGQTVTLTSSDSWYGVRVLAGGTATITYASFLNMLHGVDLAATSSVTSSTFNGYASASDGCLYLSGASNTSSITQNTFSKCSYVAVVTSASAPTFAKNVFDQTVYSAFSIQGGSPTIDHNTMNGGGSYPIYTSSTASTVSLTNNIIANWSGTYAFYNSNASTINTDYNDIWKTGLGSYVTGYSINDGAHNFHSNPLFVSGTDFHLSSTSPCRTADSTGGDVGALPYAVGPLDHIVVQPGNVNAPAGGNAYFTAIGYDASNNVVNGLTFTWMATGGVGTINAAGVLTVGCTAGTYNNAVTASSGGKSGSAKVVITTGQPTKLVVTPAPASVPAGTMQSFTANLADGCNNPISSAAVVWSTTTGTIASDGTLTAPCTAGAYPNAITAAAGDLSTKVDLTVTPGALATISVTPMSASVPSGGSQQFSATGADACGNATSATFAWATTVPGGSVTSGGLFTAGSATGTYDNGVTASASGKTGSADVSVTSDAVKTVEITPTDVTLAVGGTQQFTAVAKDKNGNVVPATITWQVTGTAGTVDADGLFTAGSKAGSYPDAVKASAAGVNATASVTVTPGAVDHIVLAPTSITIAPGGMTTLSAQAYDASDNLLSTPIDWTVSTPDAGSINSGGTFTAGATVGTYPAAILASAGGKAAHADVTISSGALFQLLITPSVASVQAGTSVGFTVVGKDASGNTVTVTPTWSVVAGGGTINSNGIFVAGTKTGTYANTVQAQAQGLSALATVSVRPGPIVSLEVSPNHPQVTAGDSVQFAVNGFDAFGNKIANPPVVWSALPAAGTIDDAGLFIAGKHNGDFANAVTADSGVITGSASVLIEGGTTAPDMGGEGTPDMTTTNPREPATGCKGCDATGAGALGGSLLPLLGVLLLRRPRRR